ncbi:MAG: hypothetical protein CMH54_06625 [Myxococcales bacterium]|nr:hypothetical protein [Myxococcales bacterium]
MQNPFLRLVLTPFFLIVVACSFLLSGCELPVIDLTDSFALKVYDQRDNRDDVKIDFLWVIDNSNSMCEEQSNLSKNFNQFVGTLNDFITIDARMAVVNTNVLGDHAGFNTVAAEAFPPPCRAEVIKKCLKDEDCISATAEADALPVPAGDSFWECTWKNKPADTLENQNGSINSRCRLVCTEADQSCPAFFGEQFSCVEYPAYLELASGCMVPPPGDNCPANVPSFLQFNNTVSNLDLFQCIATVGADSSYNANLEQGLNAARFALDPNGPNEAQAKDFLREDAWLVLIFVSDEEDCSLTQECLLTPGMDWKSINDVKQCIRLEQYATCSLLGDTFGGGPLEPVSRFVNFFKSLKNDSSKVLVASIVGDSQEIEPEAREEDINAFKASESEGTHYAPRTYICSSEQGIADLGARYISLAEAFGPNGVVANICGPSPCVTSDGQPGALGADGGCEPVDAGTDLATYGIQKALTLISETIIKRVVRICLPQPVRCLEYSTEDPSNCTQLDDIVVQRISGGTVVDLIAAEQTALEPGIGEYQIREDSTCEVTGEAIFFGDLLEPNDTIVVSYEGDANVVKQ